MPWLTAIILGLVCAFAISADMAQRKSKRRRAWVGVGFLFGVFGGVFYLIWDRWLGDHLRDISKKPQARR